MLKTKLLFKKSISTSDTNLSPEKDLPIDPVDPMEPNQAELKALKKYFGFNQFRPGQWRIIRTLLREHRDVCGILATGQGKSLCYQFPAVLSQKTVIVVSPLISLMQDQKMALLAKSIPSETLCGLTKNYTKTMNSVVLGEYRVVYTTPEFISTHVGVLTKMAENNVLELIAIDEAHCISQWGHDFRPSYRTLTGIRQHIPPNIPILALTATATPTITKDICDNLSLRDVDIIRASTDRPNLRLSVLKKSPGGWLPDLKKILGSPSKLGGSGGGGSGGAGGGKSSAFIVSDDEDEGDMIMNNNNDLIDINEDDLPDLNVPDSLEVVDDDGEDVKIKSSVPSAGHGDSTIIYTNSRKDCEAIYKDLKRVGYDVDYYHAGMNDKRRMEVHENFIYDRVPIVVATIAFGMGIDKPSIRKIINWGLPGNIETYYQEIGRAGRDGLESDCYLIYSPGDVFIHKFLIGKMECTKAVQDHHYHLLDLMKHFTYSNVCRQYQLAQYFQGDNMLNAAPTDPDEIAKFCKVCDNCQDYFDKVKNNESVIVEKVDVGKDAKILIDLVRTLSTNYGFTNLIGILTGSKAKTFPDRLKQCTYYGRGDHRSQVFWKALGDILITEGYLKYSKIGGLYGGSNRKSKKKFDNSQVMQVVTMGPKRMEGSTLLLIPPPDLYKFYKTVETEKKSKSVDESNRTGQLMQELKNFRAEISVKMNLPPYILLADTVINALLQVKLPIDISKLALVDGFNTQVLMLYGDDLVGLMNRIHNSHGGGSDEVDEIIEKKSSSSSSSSSSVKSSSGTGGSGSGSGGTVTKPSYILGATVLETKKLFDLGLSVKDIASRRNMSTSTIEGHIATIFATCENVDYSTFLEEDMKVQIEEFLVSNPNMKLSEIKEGLTEFNINASYLQIKLVLAINHRLLN